MKKMVKVLSLFLLSALLCGCTQTEETESEYYIYYMNKEQTKIVKQPFELEAEDTMGKVGEILSSLYTEVDSVEYQKPIPSDVQIADCKLNGNQLSLYFNEAYSKMPVSEEVLCRAAIVKSLIQLPDIACVSFYVGDTPLVDANENVVGLMTAESFVENPGKQINAIQTATLKLYFSNETGDGLLETTEEVQYSSNISMEKLILENLLAGPKDKKMKPTLPEGTKLLNVTTTNGTCYVNLGEGFMNQNYEIQESIVIYSIVDSLTEVSTINRVQISVNGASSGIYRDSFSLENQYERNLEYVKNLEESVTVEISTEGSE